MSVRESINHFNLLTNMLFVLNNMFLTMASDFNFYLHLQIECLIKTCLKKVQVNVTSFTTLRNYTCNIIHRGLARLRFSKCIILHKKKGNYMYCNSELDKTCTLPTRFKHLVRTKRKFMWYVKSRAMSLNRLTVFTTCMQNFKMPNLSESLDFASSWRFMSMTSRKLQM